MISQTGSTGRFARAAGRVGRSTRGGLLIRWPGLPYLSAGIGVVLLIGSVLMFSRDRPLPQGFGAIPGTASQPTIALRNTATATPNQPPESRAVRPGAVQLYPGPTTTSRTPAPQHPVEVTGRDKIGATRRSSPAVAAVVEPRQGVGFPKRIQLPSQGVDAPVVAVATSNGTLQVPPDPANVGWWVGSALPGSQSGTTVLDGHIDSATAGLGAFWKLADLGAGALVSVQLSSGRIVTYGVVARRIYPKGAGLPATLFTLTGPPALLMISCGGPFDSDRKSYEDNIAVFATLRQ